MSIDKVEILQDKLTDIAKSDPKRSFYSLRDKVYRMDFLERAWYEVKKNRGSPGPDGISIPEIEEQGVEHLLLELQEELRTDRYKPGPILRVYLPKPNGGKRPLGIPNIRDRIVQASVKLLIEPIFEADFLPMSYGFRPGKSAKDATKEIYKWLNYGHIYVLDADIEHCFDEIPHDKLLKAVSRRISDKYVLKLISMWLKSSILEDGNYRKVKKGTPQGGVISPLLANIYLDQLDKWWVHQGMTRRSGCNARMVRYADDIVILSSKPTPIPEETLRKLLSLLELNLSEKKTRFVEAKDGFDFLGFRFVRRFSSEYGKPKTYFFPSSKSVAKAKGRIREIAGNDKTHILPEDIAKQLNVAVTGWCNYFQWSWHNPAFTKVYGYLCLRFQRFLRRRQEKSGFGRYRDHPVSEFQTRYGLITWTRSTVFKDELCRECSGRAV